MTDEKKPESFWQTVPGILTAIGGIITAITGLIAALYQAGAFHHATDQTAPKLRQVSHVQFQAKSSTAIRADLWLRSRSIFSEI